MGPARKLIYYVAVFAFLYELFIGWHISSITIPILFILLILFIINETLSVSDFSSNIGNIRFILMPLAGLFILALHIITIYYLNEIMGWRSSELGPLFELIFSASFYLYAYIMIAINYAILNYIYIENGKKRLQNFN